MFRGAAWTHFFVAVEAPPVEWSMVEADDLSVDWDKPPPPPPASPEAALVVAVDDDDRKPAPPWRLGGSSRHVVI